MNRVSIRGNGVPVGACGAVPEIGPPAAFVPWSVTQARGFSAARTLTFQGLVEDEGASNTLGFSVTNGVVQRVQ